MVSLVASGCDDPIPDEPIGGHSLFPLLALALLAVASATNCNGESYCESHDDCASSEVCLFGESPRCVPHCDQGKSCPSDTCCDSCATASCPTCLDCVAACVAG